MSSSRYSGKDLFLAINDNNLDKFKNIIADLTVDLSMTDHAYPELEEIFGGKWEIYAGLYGRYENNTLLNLALSMERVDFVEELLKINHETGRDIGITRKNGAGISPISMALMINGEYLEKYDKSHNLVFMKGLSGKEKNSVMKKAKNILIALLEGTEKHDKTGVPSPAILKKNYRTPAQPQIIVELLRFFKTKYGESDKNLNANIGIFIQQYFEDSDVTETIKKLNEAVREVKKMKEEEFKHSRYNKSDSIKKFEKELSEYKKKLPFAADKLDRLKEFIILMQQDDFLNLRLKEKLINPQYEINDIDPRKMMAPPTYGNNETPFIFDIAERLLNDNKNKNKVLSLLAVLITPDLRELEFKGKKLSSIISGLTKTSISTRSFFSHAETKSETTPSDGKIHEYAFKSQHKNIITGAVAYTSIAVSMAAKLLKMDGSEFFSVFPPTKNPNEEMKKIADETLGACVLAGVDLNKKISDNKNPNANIFKRTKTMLTQKSAEEVQQGIQNLGENFGGVKDLEMLGDSTAVRANEGDSFLPDVQTFHKDLLEKISNRRNQDDLFFIATGAGHTTSYFSRVNSEGKRFYYSIDSATSFTSGKMEVYDSQETLVKNLLEKWKKNKDGYAEISVYTLSDAALEKRNMVVTKSI
jgi:hypothetical protein